MFKRKSILYKKGTNDSYTKTDKFRLEKIINKRSNSTYKEITTDKEIIVFGQMLDLTNKINQDNYIQQYQKIVKINFNHTVDYHSYQYCYYLRPDGVEFRFEYIKQNLWGYNKL